MTSTIEENIMQAYTKGITKAEFVNEIKLHMEADNFIKRTYSDGKKGCAVGCSLKSVNKLKGKRVTVNDESAAWSVAEAAGSAAYEMYADKLLELIKDCK